MDRKQIIFLCTKNCRPIFGIRQEIMSRLKMYTEYKMNCMYVNQSSTIDIVGVYDLTMNNCSKTENIVASRHKNQVAKKDKILRAKTEMRQIANKKQR